MIQAIDDIPKNVSARTIEDFQNRNQSETGGLAGLLKIKVDARVMITVNINIQDRLTNGQLGTIKHIFKDKKGLVSKIYLKLDDTKAGLHCMNSDVYGKQHGLVPIEKTETNISIRNKKDTSPVIRRTQFPLALSWACTVHKVQSLNMSEIAVSFDLIKQR